MKTEAEIREMLAALLARDYSAPEAAHLLGPKIGSCKTLLWVLGENEDDRWHIPARPGLLIDVRTIQ